MKSVIDSLIAAKMAKYSYSNDSDAIWILLYSGFARFSLLLHATCFKRIVVLL